MKTRSQISKIAMVGILLTSSGSLLAQQLTPSGAPYYAAPAYPPPETYNKLDSSGALYGSYVKRVSRLYVQGKEQLKTGNYEDAITSLEHALRYAPRNAQLNYTLGAVHYLTGNDHRASRLLERALKSNQDKLPANMQIIAKDILAEIES